ncbi:MAG: capsular biosynthesis protein [Bacteroidetes bacterium]|nr:MAG: capsular biosynthesis protein [Bacteroidota bacterium]
MIKYNSMARYTGILISRNDGTVRAEDLTGPLRQANNKRYQLLKRSFDVIMSTFVILGVLSWLTPILAILIKLNSKGPVFFIQERVGKDGLSFHCYKFRTMRPNGDADRLQAMQNDVRITGIGNVLRKSNLDELPQFFNVLAGQMSLVGPRPHMLADCRRFTQLIPGYAFRNQVTPGITGLAQIKGFSGPASDKESIFGRYQWDAFYVRNANFLLDMRIIRKTISQLFGYWFIPLSLIFTRK